MINVVVKKAVVSNVYEFMRVVTKNLLRCKSIQIFVQPKLMRQLLEQNKKSIIWKENVLNSIQHNENVEKAVIFCVKEKHNTITFQINYVNDNLEYIRIVFWASKGLLYRNYSEGMKEILIICSD